MQDSIIQITDAYNNCPGRDQIEKDLKKLKVHKFVEYADLDNDNWQNDKDTMVFSFGSNLLASVLLAEKLANQWQVDEIEYKNVQGRVVIRFWWD